jgi:hypothetical protein
MGLQRGIGKWFKVRERPAPLTNVEIGSEWAAEANFMGRPPFNRRGE